MNRKGGTGLAYDEQSLCSQCRGWQLRPLLLLALCLLAGVPAPPAASPGDGERGLGVEGTCATVPLRCCTAAGDAPGSGALLVSIGHFELGEGSLFHLLLPIYVNKSAER